MVKKGKAPESATDASKSDAKTSASPAAAGDKDANKKARLGRKSKELTSQLEMPKDVNHAPTLSNPRVTKYYCVGTMLMMQMYFFRLIGSYTATWKETQLRSVPFVTACMDFSMVDSFIMKAYSSKSASTPYPRVPNLDCDFDIQSMAGFQTAFEALYVSRLGLFFSKVTGIWTEADAAAPFFVGPQPYANDDDPNPVDIDPTVIASYDSRLLLPEDLYVFFLYRLHPLELFLLFWFKTSGVEDFATLVTMCISMVWGAATALEEHRRRRFLPFKKTLDTELSEGQQKTLRKFLESLGTDSAVVAKLRTKVGQLAPFAQFSTLTALVKSTYEADARISNLTFVTVNDVQITFDPSVLILSVVGEAYDFESQDAETIEVLGKHRMPQKTMDASLYYPINMVCATGIDPAISAIFRQHCRLSNSELLDSEAEFNTGLRRLVQQWHRDLASSFKPRIEGTTNT